MLSPINAFKQISIKHIYNKKLNKNNINNSNPYKINSIYNNNINFKGYADINRRCSFEDTIEKNYFKLPQITLDDGTIYTFKPDEAQIEAAKKLYEGDTVVFSAPTGTGKTALAHWAIARNLENHKKTIYTSPQIALANDKYNEFSKIYGKENIGLLTGDIKINTTAPILIMTTEIYDNMQSGDSKNADNTGTVIFDEAHYINDDCRGGVWENSIINTPQDKMQILFLSATIGNSREFASWVQSLSPTRPVSNVEVSSKDRYVPLVYYLYKWNKEKAQNGEFEPIVKSSADFSKMEENVEELPQAKKRAFAQLFRQIYGKSEYYDLSKEEYHAVIDDFIKKLSDKSTVLTTEELQKFLSDAYPKLSEIQAKEISNLLVDEDSKEINKIHLNNFDGKKIQKFNHQLINTLKDDDMLPAIFFKLSQSECEFVVKGLDEAGVCLTSDEEKEQIKEILDKYKKEDIYLGENFDTNSLLNGYAFHHAGMLPQYRKLIEELFLKKLLKLVVATSTLSLGINMPARTVVMSDMTYRRFNPEINFIDEKPINASEFHQMAGRAGRRGIDKLGNVVLYNMKTPKDGFKKDLPRKINDAEKTDQLALAYELLESPSNPLRSHFKPEWCFLANYWEQNSNNDALKKHIENTFKIFLAKDKDKDKEALRLLNKFENYKHTLKKQEFINVSNNGDVSITPKGKILQLCRGTNPLLLANLLYDKTLDCDIFTLAQIIGYIAGSDEQENSSAMVDILKPQIQNMLQCEENSELIGNFCDTLDDLSNKESKILKNVKESKVQKEDVLYGNAFASYITYMWALLNDKNLNSVSNFKKLTSNTNEYDLSNDDMSQAFGEYQRKIKQGSVYKIISQSISTAKTIGRVCDYALSNPEEFPDKEYWQNLKENTELLRLLLVQKPIYDLMAI